MKTVSRFFLKNWDVEIQGVVDSIYNVKRQAKRGTRAKSDFTSPRANIPADSNRQSQNLSKLSHYSGFRRPHSPFGLETLLFREIRASTDRQSGGIWETSKKKEQEHQILLIANEQSENVPSKTKVNTVPRGSMPSLEEISWWKRPTQRRRNKAGKKKTRPLELKALAEMHDDLVLLPPKEPSTRIDRVFDYNHQVADSIIYPPLADCFKLKGKSKQGPDNPVYWKDDRGHWVVDRDALYIVGPAAIPPRWLPCTRASEISQRTKIEDLNHQHDNLMTGGRTTQYLHRRELSLAEKTTVYQTRRGVESKMDEQRKLNIIRVDQEKEVSMETEQISNFFNELIVEPTLYNFPASPFFVTVSEVGNSPRKVLRTEFTPMAIRALQRPKARYAFNVAGILQRFFCSERQKYHTLSEVNPFNRQKSPMEIAINYQEGSYQDIWLFAEAIMLRQQLSSFKLDPSVKMRKPKVQGTDQSEFSLQMTKIKNMRENHEAESLDVRAQVTTNETSPVKYTACLDRTTEKALIVLQEPRPTEVELASPTAKSSIFTMIMDGPFVDNPLITSGALEEPLNISITDSVEQISTLCSCLETKRGSGDTRNTKDSGIVLSNEGTKAKMKGKGPSNPVTVMDGDERNLGKSPGHLRAALKRNNLYLKTRR